ncbi:MAG: hypothetical protein GY822_30055 [Deltaproteobacteria bacterium]|nr:hypothetical protein [Deltaproteobacteria bacterium]
MSAAASAVTTTVWVKTAETSKNRRLQADAERDDAQRDDDDNEDGIRRTLRRAQLDVEPASAALRTEVFFSNIWSAPKNVVARLRGRDGEGDPDPQDDEAARSKTGTGKDATDAKKTRSQKKRSQKERDEERRKRRAPASRRRKKRRPADAKRRKKEEGSEGEESGTRKRDATRRRKKPNSKARKRKGEDQDWGIGASIRAEVKKQVKEVAVESIKDSLEAAGDKIADTKDVLVEKSQDLGASIKANIPDDVAGTLSDAADTLKEGAGKFSERVSSQVKESMPDSTGDVSKELSKGIKSIGRYIQGPGSQDYDDGKPAHESDATFVSAQIEGEGKHQQESLEYLGDDDKTKGVDDLLDATADAISEEMPAPTARTASSTSKEDGRSIVERRLQAIRERESDGKGDIGEGPRHEGSSSDEHAPGTR